MDVSIAGPMLVHFDYNLWNAQFYKLYFLSFSELFHVQYTVYGSAFANCKQTTKMRKTWNNVLGKFILYVGYYRKPCNVGYYVDITINVLNLKEMVSIYAMCFRRFVTIFVSCIKKSSSLMIDISKLNFQSLLLKQWNNNCSCIIL